MSRLTYLNESRETTELTQFEDDSWEELIKNADTVDQIFMHNAIDKLYEYENLEEQGLLLKLPFNVGDKVWAIVNKGDYRRQHIGEFEITEISIKKINSYKKPRVHIGFIAGSVRRGLDTFGKTVFLTKEEAEQALKRMIRLDKQAGKYADNEVLKSAT